MRCVFQTIFDYQHPLRTTKPGKRQGQEKKDIGVI